MGFINASKFYLAFPSLVHPAGNGQLSRETSIASNMVPRPIKEEPSIAPYTIEILEPAPSREWQRGTKQAIEVGIWKKWGP